MTHKAKVTANLKAIPPEKLEKKKRHTFWGCVAVVCAALIAKFLPAAPWWVPVGFLCVGLVAASGEILLHPLKLLVAILRDKAAKGGEE